MQDAIARFSSLRRTGAAKDKKQLEGAPAGRLVATMSNGWICFSGVPGIVMGDMDARFTSAIFENFRA